MKKILFMFAAALTLTACSDDDDSPVVNPGASGDGLFIVCNGNYGSGNGSLSFYDPADNTVENNIFQRANGFLLGDVAQSMTVNGNEGWIVVNNSGIIYAIDLDTYKEKGRITGLTSPRNIFFVDDDTAYVTMLYDNRIAIVDTDDYEIEGYITIPGMEVSTGSTEEVVRIGNYAYVNCWSYQKSIVKIDLSTDRVVDQLEVGIQPKSIAADKNGNLWVLTDGGGWDQNPVGYEAPTLCRVNVGKFAIDRKFTFALGTSPSSLMTNRAGDTLYWLDNGVMSMSIDADRAPEQPFIASPAPFLNAMTISPANGDIYVADAIDYMQPGKIYRYSASGTPAGSFTVGVIPAGFCWK